MSALITRPPTTTEITQAFDEACDAVEAGHPDKAERILSHVLPAPQCAHAMENILGVFAPKTLPELGE